MSRPTDMSIEEWDLDNMVIPTREEVESFFRAGNYLPETYLFNTMPREQRPMALLGMAFTELDNFSVLIENAGTGFNFFELTAGLLKASMPEGIVGLLKGILDMDGARDTMNRVKYLMAMAKKEGLTPEKYIEVFCSNGKLIDVVGELCSPPMNLSAHTICRIATYIDRCYKRLPEEFFSEVNEKGIRPERQAAVRAVYDVVKELDCPPGNSPFPRKCNIMDALEITAGILVVRKNVREGTVLDQLKEQIRNATELKENSIYDVERMEREGKMDGIKPGRPISVIAKDYLERLEHYEP